MMEVWLYKYAGEQYLLFGEMKAAGPNHYDFMGGKYLNISRGGNAQLRSTGSIFCSRCLVKKINEEQ